MHPRLREGSEEFPRGAEGGHGEPRPAELSPRVGVRSRGDGLALLHGIRPAEEVLVVPEDPAVITLHEIDPPVQAVQPSPSQGCAPVGAEGMGYKGETALVPNPVQGLSRAQVRGYFLGEEEADDLPLRGEDLLGYDPREYRRPGCASPGRIVPIPGWCCGRRSRRGRPVSPRS
jgi:hypothetical protein